MTAVLARLRHCPPAFGRPAALVLVLLAAACKPDDPEGLLLGLGSYASTPVIVTDLRINGAPVYYYPLVVANGADSHDARIASGLAVDAGYPESDTPGKMTISTDWVELFTHRAWHAKVIVPVDKLDRQPLDRVSVMPIFGPNGLMIVASDPVPTSASDKREVDVARLCGTRTPGKDHDYTKTPGAVAQLRETLGFRFPQVKTSTTCPDPGK